MRRSIAAIAFAVFALPGAAQTWRVEPGEIVTGAEMLSPSKALRRPVSGSFKLVADPSGAAARTGGACLIALQGDACTSDADCVAAAAEGAGKGGDASARHGYCVPEIANAPADALSPRVCWVRPGPQSAYCRVSGAEPLEPNVVVKLPVVEGHVRPRAGNATWRVVTCQNLTPGGCPKPEAVEGVDKQYRYGPARRVR